MVSLVAMIDCRAGQPLIAIEDTLQLLPAVVYFQVMEIEEAFNFR